MGGMAQDASGELEFLSLAPAADAALRTITEPVGRWFIQHVGTPTLAQRLAWPVVAAGNNLLLSAPTGCGKTLGAFLPIIDRLLTERPATALRCLYVSPLKALGTDARRNLRLHLRSLRAFLPAGSETIRFGLRTGDTPAHRRRRLLEKPPHILLTTPESLAILLTSPCAASLFARLETVVIDEVHAVAGDKRGADLALSLERLSDLAARNLQRIGLSATCMPVEEAARFLVGTSRLCTIAWVPDAAPLHLDVELLEEDGTFFSRLVHRLNPELAANRGTLIFTNTRHLAERLAWALRRRYPAWDQEIAVHHSALAAARRRGGAASSALSNAVGCVRWSAAPAWNSASTLALSMASC